MSGVFSLQNFGRIWRKKEPDAQKARLNKACSGRAAACGPREPDGAEGAEAAWLLAHRRGPGRRRPRGGDKKGPFVPPAHVQATFNQWGLHTCVKGCIFPSPMGLTLLGVRAEGTKAGEGPGHGVTCMSSSQKVQRHCWHEEPGGPL